MIQRIHLFTRDGIAKITTNHSGKKLRLRDYWSRGVLDCKTRLYELNYGKWFRFMIHELKRKIQ